VYRIIMCSRTKIRMISSLRNLCVRILDADRFTIVVFQILDIKSNYLPGIVHILANELLQSNLAKDGYRPTPHTHGLWKHDTRPISFSLVVDDFGVKYVCREHAEHLMECIKKNYNISSDWKGSAYCGLTLDWEYKNRTVDLYARIHQGRPP
jgi:hypothetical protein